MKAKLTLALIAASLLIQGCADSGSKYQQDAAAAEAAAAGAKRPTAPNGASR